MEFIKYQIEFLQRFVNQKLIIESNKFKDMRIQNEIDQNINGISNKLFDNYLKDFKNVIEDSEEY